MTRTIDTLKALLILLYIVFSSCTRDLHNGKYVVTSVRGYTINLKNVAGDWKVTQLHRIGDTISVKRTKQESKATIY